MTLGGHLSTKCCMTPIKTDACVHSQLDFDDPFL